MGNHQNPFGGSMVPSGIPVIYCSVKCNAGDVHHTIACILQLNEFKVLAVNGICTPYQISGVVMQLGHP